MTEKNKKSNGEQQQQKNDGGESKKKESGGGGGGNVTVVLKADLHCEGCVSKVLKCIRSFDGVDTANIGDGQITVVGKVDPVKLREKVEKKTHKKVEVISPKANKNGGGGGEKKEEKKKESQEKNKSDEKKAKEKEPPITTAVLKVHLHCEGCIQKIRRLVLKTKGYRDMKIDKQKETVTVTGALDMKALAVALKKHLKREVQIVPQKEEKKDNSGGGGKGKGGGGGEKGKGGGGDKGGGGEKMEGNNNNNFNNINNNNNKMQFQVAYPNSYPYPYPVVYEPGLGAGDQFHYNPYAYGPSHAPQLFSDENPNACSVM